MAAAATVARATAAGLLVPTALADTAATALACAAAPARGSALPAVSAVSAARCTRTGDGPGQRPTGWRPEPVQPVDTRLKRTEFCDGAAEFSIRDPERTSLRSTARRSGCPRVAIRDRRRPGTERVGGHAGPRRPQLPRDVRRPLHRTGFRAGHYL